MSLRNLPNIPPRITSPTSILFMQKSNLTHFDLQFPSLRQFDSLKIFQNCYEKHLAFIMKTKYQLALFSKKQENILQQRSEKSNSICNQGKLEKFLTARPPTQHQKIVRSPVRPKTQQAVRPQNAFLLPQLVQCERDFSAILSRTEAEIREAQTRRSMLVTRGITFFSARK
ncbi:hypothetical protein SS50377_21366 [Spironucleus salmonicida]|uniref:Uncharacterized protein n=1 Tax=Spironucleus salmonicida TaxID=348837 RepID=V6LIS4_9EUKA|nr:hypothetical protein SS50377_21366 [Spironucleus salmonicida]|eukprot:EST44218.1 Hypothetical protein SS50377_15941 [Spironucleus salmonicida]